jgi:hypothetical protein
LRDRRIGLAKTIGLPDDANRFRDAAAYSRWPSLH